MLSFSGGKLGQTAFGTGENRLRRRVDFMGIRLNKYTIEGVQFPGI